MPGFLYGISFNSQSNPVEVFLLVKTRAQRSAVTTHRTGNALFNSRTCMPILSDVQGETMFKQAKTWVHS
jgi:hypothetical protein